MIGKYFRDLKRISSQPLLAKEQAWHSFPCRLVQEGDELQLPLKQLRAGSDRNKLEATGRSAEKFKFSWVIWIIPRLCFLYCCHSDLARASCWPTRLMLQILMLMFHFATCYLQMELTRTLIFKCIRACTPSEKVEFTIPFTENIRLPVKQVRGTPIAKNCCNFYLQSLPCSYDSSLQAGDDRVLEIDAKVHVIKARRHFERVLGDCQLSRNLFLPPVHTLSLLSCLLSLSPLLSLSQIPILTDTLILFLSPICLSIYIHLSLSILLLHYP